VRLSTLATRSIRQRWLTSLLTTISIVLGTALVAFLWLVADQADQRFNSSSKGYRVILGPKDTSPLGIVLSTIFHIGKSPGVIPFGVYREVHDSRRWKFANVGLRYAIPIVKGDEYRGFPIVGTTDEWFTQFSRERDSEGRPIRPLKIVRGRRFRFSHEQLVQEFERVAREVRIERGIDEGSEEPDHSHIPEQLREVVIGSAVAKRLGLTLGDRIVPTHGSGALAEAHSEALCTVVGILEETYGPIDTALYVPLALMHRVEGHNAVHPEEKGEITADRIEISAVIIDAKGPVADQVFRSKFQRRPEAQAAMPRYEIRTLFQMVGNITLALRGISYLVLIVGAIGIFVALYNTMNERRRDIAIMRALGARRTQILGIVVFEALFLSLAGAIAGVFAAHGAALGLGPTLQKLTGVPLSGAVFGPRDFALILGVAVMGGLAGLLPAIRASMTDVARYLSPDR